MKFAVVFLILFLPCLVNGEDITLTWQAQTEASGYRIYKSGFVDGCHEWLAESIDVKNVLTYTFADVVEGTHFTVGAYGEDGVVIVWSEAVVHSTQNYANFGLNLSN